MLIPQGESEVCAGINLINDSTRELNLMKVMLICNKSALLQICVHRGHNGTLTGDVSVMMLL